jgi:hypothetical protein
MPITMIVHQSQYIRRASCWLLSENCRDGQSLRDRPHSPDYSGNLTYMKRGRRPSWLAWALMLVWKSGRRIGTRAAWSRPCGHRRCVSTLGDMDRREVRERRRTGSEDAPTTRDCLQKRVPLLCLQHRKPRGSLLEAW